MLPVNFVSDDEVMKQLLRETPQGLIKFQIYSKKDEQRFADRRLNRVKNKNAIPLGPWAHTVIEGLFNEWWWLIVFTQMIMVRSSSIINYPLLEQKGALIKFV